MLTPKMDEKGRPAKTTEYVQQTVYFILIY